MVKSTAPLGVNSVFNDFLYAPVGAEVNGMDLTVLSALARRNVDPWKQAAELCALPNGAGTRLLTELFDSTPAATTAPVAATAQLPGR